MRVSLIFLSISIAACSDQSITPETQYNELAEVISGYDYLQPDTQILQEDEFSNPGFLWVDKGEELFNLPAKNGKSCATCHSSDKRSLIGVAAGYPRYDSRVKALINIEGRINLCRKDHQSEDTLAYESEPLLALTTYVANQSKGSPIVGALQAEARSNFKQGQTYFNTKRGQFNLSCAQCHNGNAGKNLRGDTISQGHGNGFPAYRLEWQTLGSLHQRFQYCDIGVRAEPLPSGSQTYIDLEYFLNHRSAGLPIETPAIRR